MKKLSETNLLVGETETITVVDFRKMPGEVFHQVSMGKTFTITSYGKPIATLKPYKKIKLLGAQVRKLGLQGK